MYNANESYKFHGNLSGRKLHLLSYIYGVKKDIDDQVEGHGEG